ncbi:MAG: hypothetical protein WCJ60_01590 [bacterium]
MGDLKISQLPDIGVLAGGDEVPVADASDLTLSKATTMTSIQTFVKNLATGGTGAGTAPLNMTAGSLLTTPEDGALEMDADCFYATVDSGNRGVVTTKHFIRLDSAYTLTNSTAKQKLFNSTTNGRLTLETGTYLFECLIYLTSMSATSGNAKWSLLGAGGATLGTILQIVTGQDGLADSIVAQSGLFEIQEAVTVTNQHTANVSTAMGSLIKGTFEVTVAGSIVPSISLTTASAGSVNAGSYFTCERIGSTTVASVGQWD